MKISGSDELENRETEPGHEPDTEQASEPDTEQTPEPEAEDPGSHNNRYAAIQLKLGSIINTFTMHEKAIIYASSALIPFLIMVVAFIAIGIYPFGAQQILTSDFWHQYYPFISDFWHKIREGGSLVWSWTAGAGSDYVANIAYYMTSPFNLLAVLFPHEHLREVLALFLLFKLSLSGLFMCMYLRNTIKRSDMLLPVFSSLYALCAFTLGFYWNIMWFDTFAVFPLVMLGVHKLVDEGEFRLYILSLAATLYFNFYIGVFVCVFTAMLFFILCVARKYNLRDFLGILIKMAAYSAIAIGMTAFLILPTYAALRQAFSFLNPYDFPDKIRLISSFYDVLGNFIAFTPPTDISGLPNLYTGLICIMMLPVFLVSGSVSLRERIAWSIAFVLLVLSTNVNVLDFIWHGFCYANSLPSRFSFLISFILAALAYRAFTMIDDPEYPKKKRIIPVMGAAALLILVMATLGIQDRKHIIVCAVLCGVYLILTDALIYAKKTEANSGNYSFIRHAVKLTFLLLIVSELSFTAYVGVTTVGSSDREYYSRQTDDFNRLLEAREPPGKDFYRTELVGWQTTVNDPSLYGFDGVSIFSSLANANVGKFMGGLGLVFTGRANSYAYTGGTPLSDAFLNIRYLISRGGNPSGDDIFWIQAGYDNGALLLENNRYLPLGFMVDAQTAGYAGDTFNPFNSQNDLFRRATGLSGELFTYVEINQAENVNYEVVHNGYGDYSFTIVDPSLRGNMAYSIDMPTAGYLYVYASISGANSVWVSFGDVTVLDTEIKHPHIFGAGAYEQGDLITVETELDIASGYTRIHAAVLDAELFEEGFALLADETLELLEFSDTRISGKITAKRDGLLYTSIPHSGVWKAFVDGSEVEAVLIDGAMVAVWLSEGEHTVEFRYHNNYLIAGSIISLLSLGAFVVLVVIKQRSKRPNLLTWGSVDLGVS